MTSADIWNGAYRPSPVRVTGLRHGPSFRRGVQADDLSDLISEIDSLRLELGIERWAHLRSWCDDPRPQTATREDLEALLERLCVRWADG